MKRFLGVVCALLLVFSLAAICLPSPVQAATFTVNSMADTTDANPGDGICDDGTGNCTLRAAIQETNALAGPDTINLPSGNYTLSIAGTGEDAAATGDLDITDNLTITGAGQVTTIIDGGGLDRVLHIHSGNVDISGITVQSGNVTGDGGGIHNTATLTLTNCLISSNTASNRGGGVYNYYSSSTVSNCTFSSNLATGGGGMFNYESSPAVTSCTFSGNSANWEGGGMGNRDNSSPTVTDCTFSGNSVTSYGGGMFNGDSSPTVTDCTFSGNYAKWGGGMRNGDSSPSVTSCNFSSNLADDGGGIHNYKSSPAVTSCTFSGNSANWTGGMTNWNSSPTVTDCTFSGNSGKWGGGMRNDYYSSPEVTDCTFSNNSAIDDGGGMYNSDNSSPTVTDCTFSSNSAGWGGGMYNSESSPMVTKCTFSSNSASNGGGGMYNHDYSSSTVTNCLFHSNNSTMGWGGGMQNQKSSPMMTNCTFSNNSGGGMLDWDSSPTVTNCIFWNNGYEISNDATSTPLVTYSDIKGGYSGATNIDDNPLFVDTATDDYHLQSGSPCIDKGTNVGAPTEDIEGNPRPIDGDGIAGAITDMGAYEYMPLTVTNTNDSGSGSLRQAILDANAKSGMDTITFNITDTGPHTIQPTSALPTITDPVIIDGYTQPGTSPNTNGPGLGTNAVLMIELDGTNAGAPFVDGLLIIAGNSTVRGLVINRFSRYGILLGTNGGNVIEGNFIGTDVTGYADLGNAGHGIGIYGSSSGNTIGGTTAGARNVISGNEDRGVGIFESTSNLVQGNFIGTDVTGTVDLGNSASGVAIFYSGASGNIIGGTTAEARNIISGNDGGGVSLWNGVTGNLVQGNFIGTDVTGTVDLGNGWGGVGIAEASNNIIGGTISGAGNIISGNDMNGVSITTSNGNLVQGNFIFSNADLGIDLGGDGVTPNDTGDGDTGANNLQNFPVLTSATSGSTTIKGTLNSKANTEFRLEFFSNSSCDPSGHGEGETFLGSTNVNTNGSGDASFTVTFPNTVPVGHSIAATATDPNNNTSEFSQCVEVTEAPTPPPVEVGGTVYSADKLAILAPWIALATALIVGAAVVVRWRRARC